MVGKTLSHYSILSELGRGGMGIIYETEDQLLGRRYRINMASSHWKKRAQAELRMIIGVDRWVKHRLD